MQSILDFILSFLKLSTNKILIGVLSIGLAVETYVLINQNDKHEDREIQLKKEYKIETDTLRSIIINNAIKSSARETQMVKDFYEKQQNISKKLEETKKQ